MSKPNPNPWSVQIELTEGCNRRCGFCGIHSLYRAKEDMTYKFMTPEMGRAIARDLGSWLPKIRIELALQGEPLLNKHVPEILFGFRSEFNRCQLMMTSNMDALRTGSGFKADKIMELFRCGLNILVADYYGEHTDMPYEQFVTEIKKASNGVPVFDFYEDNPKVWAYEGADVAKIVIIDNTESRNVNRTLNNQAGNTRPEYYMQRGAEMPQLPKMARCHLPFREISIKHDGSVPLCCMDWGKEHLMGKFPEQSLKEIWNGMHAYYVRTLLYNKRRDLISPCNRCDYHPVKVGLLQNPEPDQPVDLEAMAKQAYKLQKGNWPLRNKYAGRPFVYDKEYLERIGLGILPDN